MNDEHEHDLVRVENERTREAYDTCRTCPYQSEREPWPAETEGEEG